MAKSVPTTVLPRAASDATQTQAEEVAGYTSGSSRTAFLESHEQRKRDVMQSFIDERSAFSAKIDGDAELQAEYDAFIIESARQEKEVLEALDKGYLIDKAKVIEDYGDKADEYEQELTDKELARQEELKSGWEELAGKVRGYADALRSAQDAQTEAEIGTLLGEGQFDQAYALQEQLDKESHQRSLAGLYQYTNERKEANQKAYDEGQTFLGRVQQGRFTHNRDKAHITWHAQRDCKAQGFGQGRRVFRAEEEVLDTVRI